MQNDVQIILKIFQHIFKTLQQYLTPIFLCVTIEYMKIHLAADHAGFEYKEAVKKYLVEQGVEVIDHGAVSVDPTDDYPDFMTPAAVAVASSAGEGPEGIEGRVTTSDVGIIFGGSGQGEAMAANRVAGVRAVVYYGGPTDILVLSRAENDANILSLGVRFLTLEEVMAAIAIWSEIPFANDPRDIRRISKF